MSFVPRHTSQRSLHLSPIFGSPEFASTRRNHEFPRSHTARSCAAVMASHPRASSLMKKTWEGTIPLEIRLASNECRAGLEADSYLIHCPRLSYIPFLLPRLHSFFSSALATPEVSFSDGWLSFDDVMLKWQYPIGLLYDLYSGNEPTRALDAAEGAEVAGDMKEEEEGEASPHIGYQPPWKLVVHFTGWPEDSLIRLDEEEKFMHDAYINAVKEADFLRNGRANVVMSLSKDDSTTLWTSVQDHSLLAYYPIYQKFLNPPGVTLRHVPIKLYLPSTPNPSTSEAIPETPQQLGTVKIVQSLVTLTLPGSKQLNTLGAALNSLLPTLFPSRRRTLLAEPVLHGVVLPLNAPLESLMRECAYADGWLHVVVVMN